MSGFELLLCTSLLDCRPAPQPIEPLKSSKDWVSSGVLNPLFNGSGFKFEENNSVELSSNLNPEPLKSGLRTPLLTQSFELLSGSIGWGAGLQSSRLVQSKSSNLLKVLSGFKIEDNSTELFSRVTVM